MFAYRERFEESFPTIGRMSTSQPDLGTFEADVTQTLWPDKTFLIDRRQRVRISIAN